MGSMTFLLMFQMTSHSRFVKACEGPWRSMYWLRASIVMPRRRMPRETATVSRDAGNNDEYGKVTNLGR